MDSSVLEKAMGLMEMFPEETKAAVAKYLWDQARLFKDLAPKMLGTKYTLRNKAFVNRQFKVKKADPKDKIGHQRASAYTEKYPRFSGWEEEIDGSPRPMRSTGEGRYHRLIWDQARGGSHEPQVKGQFRLRSGGSGYNADIIPDSRQYGMPIPQFLAMLSKSPKAKDGTKRLGKNKVFILGGPDFPLGLYHFKEGDPSLGTSFPEVEALQRFMEDPPRAEKFDWRKMAEEKVKAWFSPDQVWDHYFRPIIEKLWKK